MDIRNILITGASSGIGAGLALAFARPGTRLILWGRSGERLADVAAACRTRGATCRVDGFDLTDIDRLAATLHEVDSLYPLDLAILNAGLGGSLPPAAVGQDLESARAMSTVNFTAPAVAANLLADAMAARGRGRIVLVGSVAAAFPLPMAPLYAGSKAGLTVFAEALRLRIARLGVGVTLVSPGFIDTPMSRSLSEPRPFLIGAEQAAVKIARRIEAGARHIVVPWQFAVIRAAAGLVPRPILLAMLSLVGRLYR